MYLAHRRKSFSGSAGSGDEWDISSASYDSVSHSVNSEDSSPYDIFIRSDGIKLFLVGDSSNTVHRYTMSSIWDLSTLSYDSNSYDVSTQSTQPIALFFKPDGAKMYVLDLFGDRIYQYSLSTPWDLSTASYDSKSFAVTSQDATPYGISFSPDGSTLLVLGRTNDTIYQYTMSVAWDVSTASYDTKSFSVTSQATLPVGFYVKDDGEQMFVADSSSDTVYQYSLSTGWDISTASYDSKSHDVSSEDDFPNAVDFKTDGTKMYMLGLTNDTIFQYSL